MNQILLEVSLNLAHMDKPDLTKQMGQNFGHISMQ